MTYADRIAQPDLGVFFVLIVSGVPLAFSDAPLPAAWESATPGHIDIGGELYRWHQCLQFDSDFGQIPQQIDPKKGLGSSGVLSFNLLTYGLAEDWNQDPVLDMLINNPNRTDRSSAILESDLAVTVGAGTSNGIDLSNNPWETRIEPVDIYLGEETVTFGLAIAESDTRIENVTTRGAYGSRRRTHRAEALRELERVPTSMIVTDWPITWQGRFAEVWQCTVDMQQPGFAPYGDSLASDENHKIYAGIVERIREGDDLITVTLQTSSLDKAIDGEVCRRFPTFKAGYPDEYFDPSNGAPTRIYIGPHNWFLHWIIEGPGIFSAPIIGLPTAGTIVNGDTLTVGGVTLTFSNVGPTSASVVEIFGLPGEELRQLEEISRALDLNGPPYDQWRWRNQINLDLAGYQLTEAQLNTFTVSTTANGLYIFPNRWQPNEFIDGRDSRLRRLVAGPVYQDVPEGEYTPFELAQFIGDTINDRLGASPRSVGQFIEYDGPNAFANLQFDTGRDRKPKCRITVFLKPNGVVNDWSLTLLDRYRVRNSFIRELGFDSDSGILAEPVDDDPGRLAFEADRAPARFFWPARTQILPPRLYLHGAESDWHRQNVTADHGWRDDDGNVIAPHLLIEGVDVVKTGTTRNNIAGNGLYLDVLERALFGANKVEETYIEQEAADRRKEVEVVRAPAFPNTTSVRMILYALLGGDGSYFLNGSTSLNGTFGAGWEDCGLYVPQRFVDVASFLAIDAQLPQRRNNWLWRPGQSAREMIEEECKLAQLQIVAGEGVLYMVSLDPPLETATADAFVLDDTRRITDTEGGGVGFDRDEQRIINQIDAMADYDQSTGRSLLTVKTIEQGSQSTWGPKQPMTLKVKGIRATGDANFQIKSLGNVVFATYGRPYLVIEIDSATRETWDLRVGDTVLLTSPEIPSPTSTGRGVVDLPCVLAVNRSLFLGDGKRFGRLTLISRAYGGRRWSEWVPSADLIGQARSAQEWDVTPTSYSLFGTTDLSAFEEGDRVIVARRNDFSSKQEATIDTIIDNGILTPGRIFFDTPIPWDAPSVMWFADHDSPSLVARQLRFVYWSAGRNTLNTSTGLVPAFTYL